MRERVFKVEYMPKSDRWRVTSDNWSYAYFKKRGHALLVAHAAAVLSSPAKVVIHHKSGRFLRERFYR